MLFFKKFAILIELLAIVTGFIKWGDIKKTYWKYLPFYLIIIVVSEAASYYLLETTVVVNLYKLIIIPFGFLFFFWLFYKNSQKKLLTVIGVGVYLLAFMIETIWTEKIKSNYFMSFSYSVGNIILLLFLLQYFYKLIYSDRILHFYQERMFWVSLGLIIFYLGTFPYYGLYNLLLIKYFNILVAYTWVQIILVYTMYLLFAASFIWGEKEK